MPSSPNQVSLSSSPTRPLRKGDSLRAQSMTRRTAISGYPASSTSLQNAASILVVAADCGSSFLSAQMFLHGFVDQGRSLHAVLGLDHPLATAGYAVAAM